jgi:hypothetical protein
VIVPSIVKTRSATLLRLSSDEFLPPRSKSPASRVDGCGAGSCISVESIGGGVTTVVGFSLGVSVGVTTVVGFSLGVSVGVTTVVGF